MLWRIVKAGSKALVWVSVLVGLLYLPSDIQGLPDAVAIPLAWLGFVTRESLLVAYGVAATIWIVWIEARPFLSRMFRHHEGARILAAAYSIGIQLLAERPMNDVDFGIWKEKVRQWWKLTARQVDFYVDTADGAWLRQSRAANKTAYKYKYNDEHNQELNLLDDTLTRLRQIRERHFPNSKINLSRGEIEHYRKILIPPA